MICPESLRNATGLPGRYYRPECFAIERENIFARGWVPIACASRLPQPGDALGVDVAGFPILLLRDRDGEVRAFWNICRHRAMKLVDGAQHAGAVIRCPWHSWSYALDGKLVAMPHSGGFNCGEPAPLNRDELGLKPVRSAMFLDYVFVDLSGEAPPLDEHLAPAATALAERDYSGLVHAGGWQHRYPGNWKVAIEGGVEDYHLPWGHPQLVSNQMSGVSEISGTIGVYAMTANPPVVEAFRPPHTPRVPRRVERPRVIAAVVNLFPTAVMGVAEDHLMLGLFMPDGPEATRVTFDYYFPPEAMAPEWDSARSELIRGWEEVAPQDDGFVAGVHANAMARDFAGIETRFVPAWEGAVRIFQQSVAAALGA